MIRREKKRTGASQSELEATEIRELEKLVRETAPELGVNPLLQDELDKESEDGKKSKKKDKKKKDKKSKEEGDQVEGQEGEGPATTCKEFSELPLSMYTRRGLEKAGFTRMTAIQRASIPHALAGRDVLGSAKTGSGKTLAFLIPVLELLYRKKWSHLDGLGGLIITPTRELAFQIFEELRKVGSFHNISAGLVIGGKSFKDEGGRIGKMNMLVATPGRLLQHINETPDFRLDNLQILVLDEADRILDMGFSATINSIIEALPNDQSRQTLLFSATQTNSVQQLARLSLRRHLVQYIGVHENSKTATPKKLQQFYLTIDLPDKFKVLWSFMRSHLKSKIIIFFQSCKQVRFMYETFSLLRVGTPLLEIHGKMKQMKRMAVYVSFCEKKDGVVLFATDIAARGLDFPNVDWVIQADCPEDTDTYLHRVGRTARFHSAGRALLFLQPSEMKMVDLLKERKVPIEEAKINPRRTFSITNQIASVVSQEPNIKYLAQKAFVSYLRSVYLNPNKEVFNFDKMPKEEFATSLGLVGTPRIRFVQKRKIDKNIPFELHQIVKEDYDPEKEEEKVLADDTIDATTGNIHEAPKPVTTNIDKLRKRKNTTIFSERFEKLREHDEEEEESDDELVIPKRLNHELSKEITLIPDQTISKSKRKKLMAGKGFTGVRTYLADPFEDLNEDGEEKKPVEEVDQEEYFRKLREEMERADREDRKAAKERLKEKRVTKREKRRAEEIEGYRVRPFDAENFKSQIEGVYDEEMHARAASGSDDDSDDDSDNEPIPHFERVPMKRPREPVSSSSSSSSSSSYYQREAPKEESGPEAKKARTEKIARINMAEQEDMALQILKKRGLL